MPQQTSVEAFEVDDTEQFKCWRDQKPGAGKN